MTFDREEWAQSQRETVRDLELARRVSHLRTVRQGAVTADKLTGDPHWNAFVQILQAEIEALRDRAGAEREKALGNKPLDPAKRETHRIEALVAEAVADALTRVQKLPAQLRKQGQEADQLLLEVSEPA